VFDDSKAKDSGLGLIAGSNRRPNLWLAPPAFPATAELALNGR
jgi:hypothetical protein